MRHGRDPDHLAAIDGLTRIRPRATNGIFFALGHGFLVTILAADVGQMIAVRFAFIGPWMLIVIGAVNLWRIFHAPKALPMARPIVAQPFFLGMLLAAGFETASQLSALILAGKNNPWLLGTFFSGGMLLVDGLDGFLAASTQQLAATGYANAQAASRLLGILVVIFSFGLGGAELAGVSLDRFALPLGLTLFVAVISIRIWARSSTRRAGLPLAVTAGTLSAVNGGDSFAVPGSGRPLSNSARLTSPFCSINSTSATIHLS